MMTPLDQAHDILVQNPDQDAARLRFFERLAGVELFLLLKVEPSADKIQPQVFPVEDGEFVLVFDSEARLAEFSGQTAEFVAMSGRAIVEMLMAGDGEYGLGINLGVAPSSFLLPRAGVVWLSEMLGNSARLMSDQPRTFGAPTDVDADFLAAISAKLAAATGLAEKAVLVGVTYDDGLTGDLLAFVGAVAAAESALGQAIGEVVSFSSRKRALDIGFFAVDDARIDLIQTVGLGFEIPKMAVDEQVPTGAPGMDPNSPPKLR